MTDIMPVKELETAVQIRVQQANQLMHAIVASPVVVEMKTTQKLAQELAQELAQARRQERKASATRENIIITLLTYILQERERVEEWVGDLYEMREQWQRQGLTPRVINLLTSGVALQLILAQFLCMIYDWFFTRYWGRP
jgi:hypothetical protein